MPDHTYNEWQRWVPRKNFEDKGRWLLLLQPTLRGKIVSFHALDHKNNRERNDQKSYAVSKNTPYLTVGAPAATKEINIPAEYKTVRKRIMHTPPSSRTVVVPGEYRTIKVTKMIALAKSNTIPIPAEYSNVTKRMKVADGRIEWRPVLCDTNLTRAVGERIQASLKHSGFDPGPIDGVIGSQTMAATEAFQQSKGLPTGGLTLETLRALKVSLNTAN